MGFGILFIGYFLAFIVPISMHPLMLVGAGLIAWALLKLSDYRPGFLPCAYWLIPLAGLSLLDVFTVVLKILPTFGVAVPEMPWIGTVSAIVTVIEYALTACFHFVFLRQLRGFAVELELPAIAKRADFGLWMVSVQSSCYAVAVILQLVGVPNLSLFALVSYVLQFVWAIFNLINLFTCYMYICPEGDEDMERKPSKIGFVNRIRDKMDERDRLAHEREAAARERKNKKKKK